MIDFACPKCRTKLRVPPESAGKKGKCPTCYGRLILPAGEALSPSAALPMVKGRRVTQSASESAFDFVAVAVPPSQPVRRSVSAGSLVVWTLAALILLAIPVMTALWAAGFLTPPAAPTVAKDHGANKTITIAKSDKSKAQQNQIADAHSQTPPKQELKPPTAKSGSQPKKPPEPKPESKPTPPPMLDHKPAKREAVKPVAEQLRQKANPEMANNVAVAKPPAQSEEEPKNSEKAGWRMLECTGTNILAVLPGIGAIRLKPGEYIVQVGIELDAALIKARTIDETSWEIQAPKKSSLKIHSFKKHKQSEMFLLNLVWSSGGAPVNTISIGLRDQAHRLTLQPLNLGAKPVEPAIPQALRKPPAPKKTPAKLLTDEQQAAELLAKAEEVAGVNPDLARIRCDAILRDYSKTVAAEGAKKLLQKLMKK